MKLRKLAYKHVRKARCGCSRCHDRAVAQFYICALDAHVAVCAYHDWLLNLKAVLVATSNSAKEASKWMKNYEPPDSSRRAKRSSPAASKRKRKPGKRESFSALRSSASSWEWR